VNFIEGFPKFDFLESDLENFEIATEMGGLMENLPDIVHPKGFSVEGKMQESRAKKLGSP